MGVSQVCLDIWLRVRSERRPELAHSLQAAARQHWRQLQLSPQTSMQLSESTRALPCLAMLVQRTLRESNPSRTKLGGSLRAAGGT